MKLPYYNQNDRPFNYSELFLTGSSDIRREISAVSKSGDLYSWFRLCRDWVDYWFFELDKEDAESADDLLTQIKRDFDAPRTKEGMQLLQLRIDPIEDKLSKLTRLIHVYINKKQRIFTYIERMTWQDKVKETYS